MVLVIFSDVKHPSTLNTCSASFTNEWILLLAGFGYYWQLESIKTASPWMDEINVVIQIKMKEEAWHFIGNKN